MAQRRTRTTLAQIFSIDSEPETKRLDAWQDIISNTFVSLDCEVPVREGICGSVTTTGAGPVSMTRVDTVSQTVHRTKTLVRRDDAEVLLVSCQLSGEGMISQNDCQVRLRPGDFTLYDSTRPYSLHFEGTFAQLVLHMPRQLLRDRLGPLRPLTARSYRSNHAAFSVASGYLVGLAKSLESVADPEVGRYGEVALDLLAHAVAQKTQMNPVRSRSTAIIRQQAYRVIRRYFNNPELSTPTIAKAVGVSPRRLQEAFAATRTKPMEALWEHRLAIAAKELARSHSGTSITDIAYRCGFADSAQFSRRFRARYAHSPREWRHQPYRA